MITLHQQMCEQRRLRITRRLKAANGYGEIKKIAIENGIHPGTASQWRHKSGLELRAKPHARPFAGRLTQKKLIELGVFFSQNKLPAKGRNKFCIEAIKEIADVTYCLERGIQIRNQALRALDIHQKTIQAAAPAPTS